MISRFRLNTHLWLCALMLLFYFAVAPRSIALAQATPTPTVAPVLQAEADRLRNEGNSAAQREDYTTAIEKYEQSYEVALQANYLEGQARALLNLGIAYSYLGENELALDFLEQALPIWQKLEDPSRVAQVLINIGMIHESTGDLRAAVERYEDALPYLQEANEPDKEAQILQGIGNFYYVLGEPAKALEALSASLPLWESLGRPADAAISYNFIALIYADIGQYQLALENHQAAQRQWLAAENPVEVAKIYKLLGLMSASLGKPEQALRYYTAGLDAWEALGEHRSERADLHTTIGQFYVSAGNYTRALTEFNLALDLWRQSPPDVLGEATTLQQRGDLQGYLGNYAEALLDYQQALASWGEEDVHLAQRAETLEAIGVTYSWQGDWENALIYLQQALELWQQTDDTLSELMTSLRIGRIHAQLGDPVAMRRFLREAIQRSRTLEEPYYQAILFDQIGFVYHQQQYYSLARRSYHKALALWEEMGDRQAQAQSHFFIGLSYEDAGELEQAVLAYEQSLRLWEGVRQEARIDELKSGLEENAASGFARLIPLLIQLGRTEEAFSWSEQARSRLILDQMGNQIPISLGNENGRLLQQLHEVESQIAQLERELREAQQQPQSKQCAECIQQLQTQLNAKRREYESLLTRLALEAPAIQEYVAPSTWALSEAQAYAKRQDVSLVSYYFGATELFAFVISGDDFRVVPLGVTPEEIHQQVKTLRAGLTSTASDLDFHTLYKVLIAPLKPYLNTEKLGIIPTGALNYLPFAALTDETGEYLQATYSLFFLPSVSILAYLPKKTFDDPIRALVLAHSGGNGLARLRAVGDEATAIAELFGSEAYQDEAATETILQSAASESQIIHVAAHGRFTPQHPLFSRLELAPADGEDGALEVHEVYQLDLAEANLVVLSACNTVVGNEITAGNDIVSLNRAFMAAGSPTVIASLWSVNDASTKELMVRFYENLLQGQNKADALRNAQTALQQDSSEYAHPYYWAAFILTGDPE